MTRLLWGRPRRLGDRGRPPCEKGPQVLGGVIVTLSFLAFAGSGIVTSMMPSCVFASIFLASTPCGSAIDREKDP